MPNNLAVDLSVDASPCTGRWRSRDRSRAKSCKVFVAGKLGDRDAEAEANPGFLTRPREWSKSWGRPIDNRPQVANLPYISLTIHQAPRRVSARQARVPAPHPAGSGHWIIG